MIKHFQVPSGYQKSFTVTFKNSTAFSDISLAVKKSKDQEYYDAYLYLNHGIYKLADNKYQVIFSSDMTANLEPAWYFYEMKIMVGSIPLSPLSGKIIIQEAVNKGR